MDAASGSFVHQAVTTTFSPDHIVAELFWSLVLDAALYPFIKWGIRLHDRKKHSGD